MPPTSDRGKARCGSIVSSATLAVFSKPVIAKNEKAMPARTASAGLPETLMSARTPKSASPWAMNQMPMTITMSRPATSTKVISMFITTDSVMPMKLTTTRARTKSSDTSRAGGPSQSVAK
jgi:hypothetical protein